MNPPTPTIFYYHANLVRAIYDKDVAEVDRILRNPIGRAASQIPVEEIRHHYRGTNYWGSAYTLAAFVGHLPVVEIFCQHQIRQQVQGCPFQYISPLHATMKANQINVVRLLLINRALRPMDATIWPDAPRIFMQAVASNHVEIARVLIEVGVDLDDDASLGTGRPIQLAAYLGNLEMVRLLTASGAALYPVTIVDGWLRRNAQQLALAEGHQEVAQFLGRAMQIDRRTRSV